MSRAAALVHVVGAGIAGSAAALALHAAGARVVVHEAHPHSSTDAGAFLTLAENGVRALRAIGADDAVRRASAPQRTMRVSDGAGAEITSRPLGEPGGPGFRYLTRARLCAVLQDEVRRRGIPLRHGERLTATERDGTWWFARVVGPELTPQQVAAGTTGGWSALLTDVLREEPVPRSIVAGADRVLVTNAFDLANVRVWHRDRALIIGDAAHAASPATGQGASMALEDAASLAAAIRNGSGIDAALGRYEERRRPPVEADTAASARM